MVTKGLGGSFNSLIWESISESEALLEPLVLKLGLRQ